MTLEAPLRLDLGAVLDQVTGAPQRIPIPVEFVVLEISRPTPST